MGPIRLDLPCTLRPRLHKHHLLSKKGVPVSVLVNDVKMLKLDIHEEDEEGEKAVFKTPICKSSKDNTKSSRSRSESKSEVKVVKLNINEQDEKLFKTPICKSGP